MRANIVVWQTNPEGYLVGEAVAWESPLEPGVYHIPAGCVIAAPPVASAGEIARWTDGAWIIQAAPLPPAATPEPPEE